MKKMFTLFLGAAFAFAVSAQDVALVINKFVNTPTVDGVADPQWGLVGENAVDAQIGGDFGDATMTCWFKMAYVDTALFVMVSRTDDDFANEYITKLQNWQSDRDELFFDVHIDTLWDGRGASNGQNGAYYGHYQFTSIFAGDSAKAKRDTVLTPAQWYHNKPYIIGYDFKGQNAYLSEYCFPFTSLVIDTTYLHKVNPQPLVGDKVGKIFAFCLAMCDVDMADNPTNENQRKWLRWGPASHADSWNNMDSAAYVEFGDTLLTNVKGATTSSLSVYPTNAENSIYVNADAAIVNIYNAAGQLVLAQKNVRANEAINVSGLAKGMYILSANGASVKFVK